MRARLASELLSLPVRMHGIQLGTPVAALIDAGADRLLGLEILCRDGMLRFLPFAVADVREDEIALPSALTLIDERDLEYYRRHARRLADLGYADAWIDHDGYVHEMLSAA